MGVGYSCDRCALHQRVNMFCRKKKNSKKLNGVSQPSRIKNKFESEYVEIKNMARELCDINQIAYAINDIDREMQISHAATFFYQKSIKEAYVEEMQRRYKYLMGKNMSFTEYWKTRSI